MSRENSSAGKPSEQEEEVLTASSERVKAFADAVVAIAMTLLILPLMSSVERASVAKLTTLQWLQDNSSLILLFVISFVVIANFWISHHRLFARVERVTPNLLWITVAWMLTIVWLPIATAMTGQMDTDTLQRVLYIGSMAVTSLLLLTARLYLRAHPNLHEMGPLALQRGLIADVSSTFMFLVVLVVAVLFPAIGYGALFLMLLAPLVRMFALWVTRPSAH